MLNLRSKIAQKVLSHLALHERSEMYVNEMCRRFVVDRGNLVRKLKEMEGEGILLSQWKGSQRYYRLNPSFPLIREYKKIILKTVGVEHSLGEALRRIPGVREAVLFGSYAQDRMEVSSDLDLLVVGTHDTVDLQRAIAGIQKEIDREINVISMSPEEYKRKRATEPLLRSIARNKRVPLPFPEVRFSYSYQALIKMGVALLAKRGQVKIRSVPGHHVKVLEKLSELLEDEDILAVGNAMRMKRNDDFYGGGAVITEKEAEDYLKFVGGVVKKAQGVIRS
ncbi:MAG: nucleotidyltransferase domain-containing protein [Candidatus Omnitrophica bacterium]|nr:nucleotidyltransferase domain-containing protein [Candidatus Omnitrophota bacterium]